MATEDIVKLTCDRCKKTELLSSEDESNSIEYYIESEGPERIGSL
jgi:hypothetical protein